MSSFKFINKLWESIEKSRDLKIIYGKSVGSQKCFRENWLEFTSNLLESGSKSNCFINDLNKK